MKPALRPAILSSRRHALRRLASLTASGMVPGLAGLLASQPVAAHAATAGSGYRALVCVFLYGGNDANNMVVPTDTAGYGKYHAARGGTTGTPDNGSLVLPAAGATGGVLPLAGVPYGLHPAMAELHALWGSGNLALLFNTGNLVRPLTVPQYTAHAADNTTVPASLFSHIDQQRQMQATSLAGYPTTGWAGRLADQLAAGTTDLPACISVAGNVLLLDGANAFPAVVPQSGTLAYNGFNGTPVANSRLAALKTLFASGTDATLVQALGSIQARAVGMADRLTPVLAGTSPLAAGFPKTAGGGLSDLSQQLLQVARLIQAASTGALLAPARQVFFVGLPGFDTHNDQLRRQAPLLADLSASLSGFLSSMASLGLQDSVVAFTLSDFARTLKPASGGGSDHAWGSHHLVLGGSKAIKAGTYGNFPTLQLGGPSDVSAEGRWLPTTSVDQYAATLATWLGFTAPQVASAFPNLANFAASNLGFLA